MSNQLQLTGGAKLRNLEGVLTGSTGILGSVPYGGPNGVATLDSAGKVPVSQLPNSVMEFKGTWNAATNTPTLANGTGNAGDVYLCNVAGTVNFGAGPIAFAVGDYVVYSGSTWERSSGATGTVTSVGASITGNSIGITGSPITTSGTLAFAFSGTSGQYINGAGNLVTFPSLSGYVPYTGATSDVDLGAFKLNAQSLHAKGTAGAGHLGLKHQSASATATANESSLFADVNGDMAWKNDSLYLITLNSHLNTADRTYTFPDASGTIALTSDIPSLAGYVPYTGATTNVNLGAYQLTATNLIANGSTGTSGMLHLKNDASQVPKGNGYTSIGASSTSILVQTYTGVSTYKSYLLNASLLTDGVNRIYNLPDASGTIALVGGSGVGTVTSVALSAPTGFSVSGSPVTSSGTLALSFASGYSLPTTASQTNWDTAYTNRITSLTTTGSSGAATLISNVLNIPNYELALSGYLPLTGGTLTGPLVGTIATFVASTGNRALTLTGAANAYLIDGTASTTTGQSYGPIFRAGTNSSDSSLIVTDANASTTYFVIKGDGEARFKYSLTLGNVIGTGMGAFYAGAGTFNGNVTLGNTTTYSTLSITQQNNVDALLITDGYNSNFKIQSYINSSLGNLIYSNNFTNTGYVPLTAYSSKFSLPVGSLVVGGSADNGYALYTNGSGFFTSSVTANGIIKANASVSAQLVIQAVASDGNASIYLRPNNGGYNLISSNYLTSSPYLPLSLSGREASSDLVLFTSGRIGVNTTTDAGYQLDVNGTGRFKANALTLFNSGSYAAFNAGDGTYASYFGYAQSATHYSNNSQAGDAIVRGHNGVDIEGGDGGGGGLRINNAGAATFSSSVDVNSYIRNTNSGADNSVTIATDGSNAYIQSNNAARTGYKNLLLNPYGSNVGIGTTSPLQTGANRTVTTINGNSSAILNLGVGGNLISYYYAETGSSTLETLGTNTISASGANIVNFLTNGTERMRITSSGNVGIGVTGSNWGASQKAIDVNGASIMGASGLNAYYTANAYFNSGWYYKITYQAAVYGQENGAHVWYQAPSGTAGTAITLTQAMTLKASGILNIANVPTSTTGLVTGDIYKTVAGVLMIVL